MKRLRTTIIAVLLITVFCLSLTPGSLANGHLKYDNGILEYSLDNESIAINNEDLKEGIPELFYVPWFASPYTVAEYFEYVDLFPWFRNYDTYCTLIEKSDYGTEMETMEWPIYSSEKDPIAKILGMDLVGFNLNFFFREKSDMSELTFAELYFNEDLRTVLTKLEERYGSLGDGYKKYEAEDFKYDIYVKESDWYRLNAVDPCTMVKFSCSHKH